MATDLADFEPVAQAPDVSDFVPVNAPKQDLGDFQVIPSSNEAPGFGQEFKQTPTIDSELTQGNIGKAAGLAYENVRRHFSGLIGPTQSERIEGSTAFGKNPDGSTAYSYKPLGDRLAQEGGLFTPFLKVEPMQPSPGDSTLTGVGKAIFNVASGLEGSLLSPGGITTPFTSGASAKIIGGAFNVDMISNAKDQIQSGMNATTTLGKVEGYLGGAVSLAMAALGLKHSFSKPTTPEIVKHIDSVPDEVLHEVVNQPEIPSEITDAAKFTLQQRAKSVADEIQPVLGNLPGDVQDKLASILTKQAKGEPISQNEQATLLNVRGYAAKSRENAGDVEQFTGVAKEAPPMRPGWPSMPPSPEATANPQGEIPSAQGSTSQLFKQAQEQERAISDQTDTTLHEKQNPLDLLRQLEKDATPSASAEAPEDASSVDGRANPPVNPAAEKMASDLQKLGRVNRDSTSAVESELGYYSEEERTQLQQHLGTPDAEPETLAKAITGRSTLKDAGGASPYVNEPAGSEGRGHPTADVAKEAFGEDYTGGPGAMGPRESAAMAEKQGNVGIRNAMVDAERVKRGLPPRVAPIARAFGGVWDTAMRMFNINPDVGRELVDSLSKRMRPLTDTEDAVLTHEQLMRHEAYDEAVDAVNKAEDPAEITQAEAQLAKARDDVHQIYDVGTKAGTANARGLNARKLMVREDYSLAKMEARKRAENGGAPLSEDQLKQVSEAHAKIAELEKKIAAHEADKRDDLAKHYFDQLLSETKRDVKESIKSGKSLTDFISDQAAKARARIKERGPRLSAGIDPVDLVDHAIIGADYISKGITGLAEWSVKMVKDFGEKIRPYLQEIYDKSKQYHDAHETLFAKSKSKADLTPKDIVASAKEDAKSGQSLDHRTVYDLARAHVRAGVEGFDAVMKAVHEDLKEAYPNITEREVRDAFSEYGKVKFPSKEEDKVKLAEYRRIGQLQSAIEDAMKGEQPQKTGLQRNKPTQAVRDKMKELKAAMEDAGLDTRTSEAQLAGRLDAYKTRLRNGTEDLQKRIASGDYSKRVTTKTPIDAEAFKLRADYEREKQKFDSQLAKDAANNRTGHQKLWDRFVGIQRAMKLTSDVVLAKLSLAAAAREGVLTPAEEAVGGVVSKALPGLAARAPREGGFSPAAEIKAKAELFTRGMRDAYDNLRMRKSDLEVTYGNKRPSAPPEWYEYMGFMHAALKAPVKRAEFARSLTKRMIAAERDGVDLNNPETMLRLSQESYVDANRAIFMQDNVVSQGFNAMLGRMEKSKTSPNLGPALARLGRFLVPIVKVPTNIVGEVATGIHGVASGGVRTANAYIKGIESLPPEQGDAIMRQLKKGLIGNALLLTGYFGYKSIGGFYHDKDQRQKTDVQPGRFRVGDTDLPSSFSHSTAAMLLNVGATLHRVQDEKAKGGGTKGPVRGTISALSGVANQLPFVPAVSGLSSALATEEGWNKYLNDLVTSSTTPAILQHVAKVRDTPGTFPKNAFQPSNRRSPQSIKQAVEVGIPGIRETVPLKKAR